MVRTKTLSWLNSSELFERPSRAAPFFGVKLVTILRVIGSGEDVAECYFLYKCFSNRFFFVRSVFDVRCD